MVTSLAAQSQPFTTQTLAQAPIPQEDQHRKDKMRDAWKAYRGEFQRPLKVAVNQPDDNVIANRCSPIVDKGVSFLFGQVLKLECDEQDFMDGLWGDDDDRMTLLSNMGINGGVCGHVFVKLIPAQGDMQFPRIVVMDPQIVTPITAPDDCTCVYAYIIEYPGVADFQKRQIICRIDPDGLAGVAGAMDLDDTWEITNYLRKGQSGMWQQVGSPETWPYPFAPIFTNQNLPNPNEFWGTPDLTPDLINENKVLNFVQSNLSRIIKFHGHPKTFIKGARADQIQMAIDDVICFDSPTADMGMLSAMENFTGILAFIEDIRSNMDEQSRVPAVALGRESSLPKGNISGVALQLLFQPLIEKTVQKQRLYGRLIRDISRAALVIAGKISVQQYEDYQVDLHWQNLLPVDDLAAAQTGQLLLNIGVSPDTVMQQLGYDPDDEDEKNAARDAKKLVNFSRGQGMPPALPQPGQQQPGQPPMPGMQQQGGQQGQ